MHVLAEIKRKKGFTLMVVAHNEHLAAAMGRTMRMADGRMNN